MLWEEGLRGRGRGGEGCLSPVKGVGGECEESADAGSAMEMAAEGGEEAVVV